MPDVGHVAIVGAGPGGLVAFANLRYRGIPADQITVFDDSAEPLAEWRRTTGAILQEGMRSESEGHFFPTDFPGFALMDAIRGVSPVPLLRSAVNRYNPSLGSVLQHGIALSEHFGMPGRIRPARVTRLSRDETPEPHVVLQGEDGLPLGRARHVFLALGHGPRRWPVVCSDPEVREDLKGKLFHAYDAKPYDGGTVLVIGSGMGAVTEWVNVLRGGGRVIALRRRNDLIEQQLSAPRCAFGGPWLDRYHALGRAERAAVLADLSRGTYPRHSGWQALLDKSVQDGRLQHHVGEITALVRDGQSVVVSVPAGEDGRVDLYRAETIIAATGFMPGWRQHGLLRELVAEFGLESEGHDLILADDCTIPIVSRPGSVVALSGSLARWAFPAGDSLAGMKYAARRFAQHAANSRRGPRPGAWFSMVRAGWPHGARAVWRGGEPCASP